MRWNQQYGSMILLMVILFDGLIARNGPGIIGWLLRIPAETLTALLLGIKL
jgi:hypothetical protein